MARSVGLRGHSYAVPPFGLARHVTATYESDFHSKLTFSGNRAWLAASACGVTATQFHPSASRAMLPPPMNPTFTQNSLSPAIVHGSQRRPAGSQLRSSTLRPRAPYYRHL